MTNEFEDFFGLGTPKKETPKELLNKEFNQDDFIHKEQPPNLIAQVGSTKPEDVIIKEIKPIDRYGKCPNPECDIEWNMGDILANIKKLQVFAYKSDEELVNLALNGYGYHQSNPKNFSRVAAVQVIEDTVHANTEIDPNRNAVDPHFYMCPKCRQAWDVVTGQHYGSIVQAKRLRGFNDEYNNTELSETSEE